MDKGWVFDAPHARLLSERRKEFLNRLLQELRGVLDLKTALDVGCGIRVFSKYLSSLGLKVTSFDARENNIAEARRRCPEVDFHVLDVEDSRIRQLGQFDLVLCFGLLYHLENPFRAVRNLYAVTGKVLIIETMVSPSQSPVATLMSECHGEDQAVHYVAFVPSEACLIKMLYRAGFAQVYNTTELPNHEDYRASFSHQRRRTVLVASKINLGSSLLRWIPEPQPIRPDIWQTRLGFEVQRIASSYSSLRSKVRLRSRIRAILARVSRRLPVLTRLPWRGTVLAWNDVMGQHLRKHDDFEQGEQAFLLQFLQPGMVVLDIGAHQGLYTLLASEKVGSSGQVFAFEPSPRELRRLRWNLLINRCRNVRVVPSAVGSHEGTAELFVCLGQETGCNSLRPPAVSEPVSKVQVPITTLDRYLERIGTNKVNFVKIDVEGAELEVLKGARRLLSDCRPLILCELADVRTEPWGYPSLEIYQFLAARGYRWFSITPEGRLQPCPRKEHFHENLIAVPEEKLGSVATFLEESGDQCIESS